MDALNLGLQLFPHYVSTYMYTYMYIHIKNTFTHIYIYVYIYIYILRIACIELVFASILVVFTVVFSSGYIWKI